MNPTMNPPTPHPTANSTASPTSGPTYTSSPSSAPSTWAHGHPLGVVFNGSINDLTGAESEGLREAAAAALAERYGPAVSVYDLEVSLMYNFLIRMEPAILMRRCRKT